MFNLEQAIAEWRQQMIAAGIKSPGTLDELENHLREDFRALSSGGATEAEAFRLAAARVGNPDSVAAEFKKSYMAPVLPVILGSALWIGVPLALAVVLFNKWFGGRPGFLLLTHSFTLTAGYSASFLTGSFGICHVGFGWFRMASPVRCRALSRAVYLFSQLAGGFTMAGLLTGMSWSMRDRGNLMTGDPREIGALFVVAWFMALWLVQRSGRVREHVTLLLSIGGNMIVSLAWFGAGTLAHHAMPWGYWPLDVLLVVHLVVLSLGILSPPEMVET